MLYGIFAEIILVLHLAFLLFTVFGGLLMFRWKWIWKFHFPTLVWGFILQVFLLNCPLTTLEKYLRLKASQSTYQGGFIEYYLISILYPSISANSHLILGILLVISNLIIYLLVFARYKKYK